MRFAARELEHRGREDALSPTPSVWRGRLTGTHQDGVHLPPRFPFEVVGKKPGIRIVCINEIKVYEKRGTVNGTRLGERTVKDRWVLPGGVIGVGAGMIFITYQMLAVAFVGTDFLSPLILVGSAVLGWVSLDGLYPMEFTAVIGLLVYSIVFAALGSAFGASSVLGRVRRNLGARLVAGTIFGTLLWTFNLALTSWGVLPVVPAADLVAQLVAHWVFFGAVLALVLGIRLRGGAPATKPLAAVEESRNLDLTRTQ